MKNYAKVGKREGKPAYRTPSRIRYQRSLAAKKNIVRTWNLATRLDLGARKKRSK